MVVQELFSGLPFLIDDHQLLLSKDFSSRGNCADVQQGIVRIFKIHYFFHTALCKAFPCVKLSACQIALIFMELSVIARLDVLLRI